MKANKEKIVLYSSFALYCIWTILSAIRHEAGGDEYHVWRMVHDMNLGELWQSMSVEGHFIIWHLLQWPFIKWFGMDYHCIYIVSVSLMILAAWLLLFKLKFNTIGKLLILFSAPFCYYFPVIARCYALIPPILLGLAILYQQKRYPILYCILLGLLANTHAYIEGLVAILWCLFVYNEVILKYKIDQKKAKKNAWASLITIVFVGIAFAQVVGGLGSLPHGGWDQDQHSMEWYKIFISGYQFKLFYTAQEHFSIIPDLDVLVTIVAWICAIIGVYNHIKESSQSKWQMCAILFFGIAWQIFFACNIYVMAVQRIFLLYFVIIFVLWLSYESQIEKWAIIALFAFWLLNTTSQYVVIKDIYTHSGGPEELAKQYDDLVIHHNAPGYSEYIAQIDNLMKHKFEYTPGLFQEDVLSNEQAILQCISSTGDCYLMINSQRPIESNKYSIDTLVASQGYGPTDYNIYYIKRKNDENIE